MSTIDTAGEIEMILSLLRTLLETKLENKTLTPESLLLVRQRGSEFITDSEILIDWLSDADHPDDPGVARTLRRLISKKR
jgi:hypothetical protein